MIEKEKNTEFFPPLKSLERTEWLPLPTEDIYSLLSPSEQITNHGA